MKIQTTTLPGVLLIKPTIYYDERGHFFESFSESAWRKHGLPHSFVQDNQSFSKKGVIRGLHFQSAPFAQGKLVRVITGKVIDVAVDLRPSSPTFGHFEMFELDAIAGHMVYIPEGFAHGFGVLEDAIFHYKCTASYNKGAEGGLHWNDPSLSIPWNINNPTVSQKDDQLPSFQMLFEQTSALV
jgi:dTDP-4-dehydrorhamnose 3,5-epimerase